MPHTSRRMAASRFAAPRRLAAPHADASAFTALFIFSFLGGAAAQMSQSNQIALGVGIGIGVGVPVVLAIVLVVLWSWYHSRARALEEQSAPKPIPEDLKLEAPDAAEAAAWLAADAARRAGLPVPAPSSGARSPARLGRSGGARTPGAVVVNGATANGSNRALKMLRKSQGVYGGQDVRFHRTKIGRGRRTSQANMESPVDAETGLADDIEEEDEEDDSSEVGVDVAGLTTPAASAAGSAGGRPMLSTASMGESNNFSPLSPTDVHVGIPDHEIHVDFNPKTAPILNTAAKHHQIKSVTSTGADGSEATMFAVPEALRNKLGAKSVARK